MKVFLICRIGTHVQQNCNFFQEQIVKLLKLYSLAQRVQLEVIVKSQSLQFQYKLPIIHHHQLILSIQDEYSSRVNELPTVTPLASILVLIAALAS